MDSPRPSLLARPRPRFGLLARPRPGFDSLARPRARFGDRTRRAAAALAASLLGASLLVASTACVEPSYDGALGDATLAPATRSGANPGPMSMPADMTAPSMTGVSDAAVVMRVPADMDMDAASATPPAWAVPLLGQYAVRVRSFARGTGPFGALNQLKSEWLLLGTFSFDAQRDEVHLSTQICRASGDNNVAGIVATVSPRYPQLLPTHEYRVQTRNDEWSTSGDPVRYGFQEQPLVSCLGMDGQRVKGADEQRWLKDGQCLCPSSDALPMTQDDCRINDVDDDRQPGATVSVVGAVNSDYYVRLLDAGEFVHGQFDAAGAAKSSGYAQNSNQRQLACNPEPCPSDDSVPCDPSRNPVLFGRLGDPGSASTFSCDDVLRSVPTLFPSDALAFPTSGC